MARLSETEKAQLVAATRRNAPRPPRVPVLSAQAFVAFATFASTLKRAPKPVRFSGSHWKL
jgi:hypothetical protein